MIDHEKSRRELLVARRLLWRKWAGRLTSDEVRAFENVSRETLFEAWAGMVDLLDDDAPGVLDEERDDFIAGWEED
jgi:hypothetical protein